MPLATQIARRWPADQWRDCHVLVAVSGGADSVALLRALLELRPPAGRGELIVAHFNHQTRGEHSTADEVWVCQLAENLGLRAVVGQPPAGQTLASELEARQCRYDFLRTTAQRLGARFVATAHTADDQVETLLMRVLRGSGIDGLAGIPFARQLSSSVTLVRPLLEVRRAEIESYLAELAQDYRTDGTNFESQFTRNWVRNELLPMVRARLNGDPDLAILRLAQQAGDWQEAIDRVAGELAAAAVAVAPGRPAPHLAIDRGVLAAEPAIVVQQVCRLAWKSAAWPEQSMGMTDWQRLAATITDPRSPAITLPGGVDVRPEPASVVLRFS